MAAVMNAPQTVGALIRSRRDDLGLTQDELAEKVGVKLLQIGRYERDENLPGIDVADKLADVLGVPVSEITHLASVQKLPPMGKRK